MLGHRYQWDVQPAVLRIAASMRARRFKVWVDTEMMSGSTLDAMAAAVEDAYCVLICITERYKVPRLAPVRGSSVLLASSNSSMLRCGAACREARTADWRARTCTSSVSRGCRS